MNRKTVFIIPGFKQKPTSRAYKTISKILKSEGYFPVLVSIPWKKSTISENTEFFLKKYKKIDTKKKYILGFSFGAMIAFLASTKVRTAGLILCSLSPYFKEDISSSPLRCTTLAKQTKAKQIHLLYGTRETKSLITRVTDAFDNINSTRKYLIPIQKTEHNIGDKRYLRTILQATRDLH